MGGKPSKGTPADKRLGSNKPTASKMPTPIPKQMPPGMKGTRGK